MIHIVVADLDPALERCQMRGGKLLGIPKTDPDKSRSKAE
jgi:hypothetical protein